MHERKGKSNHQGGPAFQRGVAWMWLRNGKVMLVKGDRNSEQLYKTLKFGAN